MEENQVAGRWWPGWKCRRGSCNSVATHAAMWLAFLLGLLPGQEGTAGMVMVLAAVPAMTDSPSIDFHVPGAGLFPFRSPYQQTSSPGAGRLWEAGLTMTRLTATPRAAALRNVKPTAVLQGAIGAFCREADAGTLAALGAISHNETRLAILCERAFLSQLEAYIRHAAIAGLAEVGAVLCCAVLCCPAGGWRHHCCSGQVPGAR